VGIGRGDLRAAGIPEAGMTVLRAAPDRAVARIHSRRPAPGRPLFAPRPASPSGLASGPTFTLSAQPVLIVMPIIRDLLGLGSGDVIVVPRPLRGPGAEPS
jgi:hypothetical protein